MTAYRQTDVHGLCHGYRLARPRLSPSRSVVGRVGNERAPAPHQLYPVRQSNVHAALESSASTCASTVGEKDDRRLVIRVPVCGRRVQRLSNHHSGFGIIASLSRNNSRDDGPVARQRLIYKMHLVGSAINLVTRALHRERPAGETSAPCNAY